MKGGREKSPGEPTYNSTTKGEPMNSVIKWSLILVVLVTAANLVILGTGMHKSMVGGLVFIALAVLLNIGAVVMALRETSAESSYGKQLVNGLLIGAIAGVLIFGASWLTLSVFFPQSIPEMVAGSKAFLESAPLPEAQKEQQMAALDETTAMGQALSGLIGTFFTSALVAAIAAAFLRKK